MNQEKFKLDAQKIATANEAELSRLLNKYKHLQGKQDESVRNVEIILEQTKNNAVQIKDMIFKLNVALTPFQTVTLFTKAGKKLQVDKENFDLFLADGYIHGHVFIFQKTKNTSKLHKTLTIEDYQLQYGEELHPMYEVKKVGKTLYAVIGVEQEVFARIQQNNAVVEA